MDRRTFMAGMAVAPLAAYAGSARSTAPGYATGSKVPSLLVSNIASMLSSQRPDLLNYFAGDGRSFVKATPVPGLTPMLSYTSYAQFKADLGNGTLNGLSGAWVMYGIESATNTPTTEKQDPKTYLGLFSQTAHANGFHTILVPGIDLVFVTGSNVHANAGEPGWKAYLRTGIPAACNGADIFLCQSQQQQATISNFTSLLQQAKAQTPDAVMWGGLTTLRSDDTASNYAAAYTAGLGAAQGYWHNSSSATFTMLASALDTIKAAGN